LHQLACAAPCIPGPPIPESGTFGYSEKLDWFGTVRGRAGVVTAERWLLFVTGGLAYGKVESSGTINVPAAGVCTPGPCGTPLPTTAGASFSHTNTGWALGGGIEAAINRNWTAKLEYLHIDLGNTTDSFRAVLPPPFGGTYTITNRVTDDILRVGLNYQFH
jgi:outer membrane immunogenic protein